MSINQRVPAISRVTTRALAEVLGAEAAKKPRLLLVDISGLVFIDSAALHEIVRVHRELKADGSLLALVGPTPEVARILQLSGIDQVIPVHARAEDADAQLQPAISQDPGTSQWLPPGYERNSWNAA